MRDVTVHYHHEPPAGWWAESADLEGWSAAADGLSELQQLVREGIAFVLDGERARVRHRRVDPPQLDLLFTRAPDQGAPELTVWTHTVTGSIELAPA